VGVLAFSSTVSIRAHVMLVVLVQLSVINTPWRYLNIGVLFSHYSHVGCQM